MHFIFKLFFKSLLYNILTMKIILIGYMGSGKTTLGKALSLKKNVPFIDLDQYIEMKEGASVRRIFKDRGEIYFRKIESYYLSELLASQEDFVLAVGGGTPCFGNNMQLITDSTEMVVYMKYQPKSLAERLLQEKHLRPLIADIVDTDLEDFIRKHLFDRNPFYMQAKYHIPMDGLTDVEGLKAIERVIDAPKSSSI